MNLIRSMRSVAARLFALSVLSLTGLNVSAVPLMPGMLMDTQFQTCLDEAAITNGWTLTEEVTALSCPDREISYLGGIENFPNLTQLNLSGNVLEAHGISPMSVLGLIQVLDLSDNKIDQTYGFDQLTGLTQLNLSGNARLQWSQVEFVLLNNPGLTHLGIADIKLLDLSFLPYPNMGGFDLQELDISRTGVFYDLTPVSQYINLRVLKAAGNYIRSDWSLSQLPQLQVLDLSDNNLGQGGNQPGAAPELATLQNLSELNLSGNNQLSALAVQNIIQSNPGLTHINIADINMGGTMWLPPVGMMGEFDLVELDISNTGIVFDLGPVGQYANLRVFKAADNQIQTVWGLDQLQQLDVLDLSNNNLQDIFPLQMLNNLSQLNLSGNSRIPRATVRDLVAVNPGLTHIGIADINMQDLLWLPPVGLFGEFDLIELDISNTGVIDRLVPLTQYTKLRSLKAAGIELRDTLALDQLPQLEVLDLGNNNLMGIFELQALTKLTQLNLSGSKNLPAFDVINVIQLNPGLTHLGVADIQLGALSSWLPSVGLMGEYNFEELDVSNTNTAGGVFQSQQIFDQYTNLRVIKTSGNNLDYIFLPASNKLEELDLSNNNLFDLLSLQGLQNLKHLNLAGNARLQAMDVSNLVLTNPGLTHLNVAGLNMVDLNWLPPVGFADEYNFQELDISNTGSIMDLGVISQYTNLKSLKASGNQVRYVNGIEQLAQLEILDLSDNQLFDAVPLQGLGHLTQLNLSGNSKLQAINVQNIVMTNIGLTHLYIRGISMGDLNWLPPVGFGGEHNLQVLDISYTGSFIDLMPLTQYPDLRSLKAAGNKIESVMSLDQLQNLQVLDLSDNNLVNLFGLQMFTRLSQLSLSGNSRLGEPDAFEIQNLIRMNRDLTHLGVAGIPMGDPAIWLPPVDYDGAYNFEELDISNVGQISMMFFIQQYEDLRVLKIAGNSLWDVAPLDRLYKLEVLDISNNEINNILPLQSLNNLQQLNISNNKVVDEFSLPIDVFMVNQVTQANPGLTHLGIAGVSISSLNELNILDVIMSPSASKLIELDISNTGVVDITRLLDLQNLRVLNASNNAITDTFPLSNLQLLEVLDISNNALPHLAGVQSLFNLKELHVSGNTQVPAFDLAHIIPQNTGLTHLSAAGITMGDLLWLPPVGPMGEHNFVELDISSTGVIIDVSILSQYSNLQVLKAANNSIESIWSFDQLQQLEVLDLSNNSISDISMLSMLQNLRELNLSNNVPLDPLDPYAPVIDLFAVNQVVGMNPGLTHLGVAGIYIGFIDQLAIFGYPMADNIVELDVSNTGIMDLSPTLSSLTSLNVFRAANNLISDVNTLTQMQQLEVIDLSNNNLDFVYFLSGLQNLTSLDLSGNNNIQCVELDDMETLLLPGVLIRPASCAWFTPPTVTIQFPFEGLVDYQTTLIPLGANAFDAEDGNLDAQIQWSSSLDGHVGVGPQVEVLLSAGDHTITAEITDSHGNSSSASVNITMLVNTAPVVVINPVLNGALFNEGESVFMSADASDQEQGDVSGSIQWTSNIDGYLGTGPIVVPILSPGVHVIAATVWDANFAMSVQTVSVTINAKPSVNIIAPQTGVLFQQGDSVSFQGAANDPEDGALDANIIWSSNIDGVLGTGALVNYVLSPGVHTITVSITDSNALSMTQDLIVNVNHAPQLNVLSPLNASVYQFASSVSLAASANDVEDGVLDAGINWTSSLDGVLGTGFDISAVLSEGVHTITATVADTSGATITQSVSITVNPNVAPGLTLDPALNGSVVQHGVTTLLSAVSSDLEDGDLSSAVNWFSGIDGVLGTGSQLTKVLSVGNHVITASITDSAGAVTTQTSSVSVNSQPVVTLTSPVSGSLYMLQEVVNLSAAANDAEDGVIGASIQWSSNLDGLLGAGANLITNLSLGTHTITAQVTDSAGGVHSVTTQVVMDQIDLNVAVTGNGFRKFATLTWSGSRTAVDIYKNGRLRRTGTADGSTVFRFRNQATFKVCETGTNNCSIDFVAIAQ